MRRRGKIAVANRPSDVVSSIYVCIHLSSIHVYVHLMYINYSNCNCNSDYKQCLGMHKLLHAGIAHKRQKKIDFFILIRIIIIVWINQAIREPSHGEILTWYENKTQIRSYHYYYPDYSFQVIHTDSKKSRHSVNTLTSPLICFITVLGMLYFHFLLYFVYFTGVFHLKHKRMGHCPV